MECIVEIAGDGYRFLSEIKGKASCIKQRLTTERSDQHSEYCDENMTYPITSEESRMQVALEKMRFARVEALPWSLV